MKFHETLEPLESRIAPAALITLVVTPHKATWTDVDGDHVTLTVSTGALTSSLFSGIQGAHGDQLQTLDLSGGGFDHANITVTVAKAATGDGHVNIGCLNSTGHDLGAVSIAGDLGQIDAGDSTADGGIKSLTVNSIGRFGTDTQNSGSGSLESDIVNGLGSLTVAHNVTQAFIHVSGSNADADGTIGTIKIGGSLIGGPADDSGQIRSDGKMGAVTIGEDIRGSSGAETGMIFSNGGLGNVTVGGSLIGGYSTVNSQTGIIFSFGAMGAVKIGHDVDFGAGSQSGYIQAENSGPQATDGTIASVTIGGSLIGNSISGGTVEADSGIGQVKIGGDILGGLVNTDGSMGNVTVGGSILPGNITSSGVISCGGNMGFVTIGHNLEGTSVLFSGLVFAIGNIKGVHVGGSIVGGGGNAAVNVSQTGGIIADGNLGPVTLANSGSVIAGQDLGSLSVGGSIIGQPGAGHGAIISADGQTAPTGNTNVAIGKITVAHRVENAEILAGYEFGAPDNADAQIGSITVGGDWIASSLVAGAVNLGADHMPGGGDDNLNFGNADDTKISGGVDQASVLSKIASILIKGDVIGTPNSVNASDNFGFVAESFGSFVVGGAKVTIPSTPGLLNLVQTNDVNVDKIN